jgi:hypothetical protein
VADKELAIVVPMKMFQRSHPLVKHPLCIVNRNLKQSQKILKFKVLDSERQESIDQATTNLIQLLPTLENDIGTEIIGLLPCLSETYRGDVFTFGIHRTGEAERANYMLESTPPGTKCMRIREAQPRNHQLKRAADEKPTTHDRIRIEISRKSI